jgi:hypothetical protein
VKSASITGAGSGGDVTITPILEVVEESGTVWAYDDPTIANVVAAALSALHGDHARIRGDRLSDRLIEAGLVIEFWSGSHVWLPAPVQPGRLPPKARQVPCGTGVLVIHPITDTDDDAQAISKLYHALPATRP